MCLASIVLHTEVSGQWKIASRCENGASGLNIESSLARDPPATTLQCYFVASILSVSVVRKTVRRALTLNMPATKYMNFGSSLVVVSEVSERA